MYWITRKGPENIRERGNEEKMDDKTKLAMHFQKYKKKQITLIYRHNLRKNRNYDNPDIDLNRSNNNTLIKIYPEQTLLKAAKRRIKEAAPNARINSESVWIIEGCVFCPKDIAGDREKEDDFFSDVVKKLGEKWGTDNILMAVVHRDESDRGRSHAHIDICPITKDGRLCGKEFIDKPKLIELHTEMSEYLQGLGYNIERGTRQKKGKKLKTVTAKEYKEQAEAEKREMTRAKEQLAEECEELLNGNVALAQEVLEQAIDREWERCR